VPASAILLYESLRSAVLHGHARPDGLGAIVYHGLVHGLRLLSQAPIEPVTPASLSIPNVVLGVCAADSQIAVDRIQQLVSEVALGHAGIVLGLEVSRLARNNADWHRLLELAALTQTLILDEDGIYDPAHFNDRLLLGLKGTMSEAELHVLKARLLGGQRNKARRGELEMALPIGLVYDAVGAVTLDPDQHIQQALRMVFDTFREVRSATAVLRRFVREGLRFPRRIRRGIGKGDVLWGMFDNSRVAQILHNPRYAGAYVYGRTRSMPSADLKATTQRKVARQD
jgi:DNA invertase Pin-like site-specific DNA recombinase